MLAAILFTDSVVIEMSTSDGSIIAEPRNFTITAADGSSITTTQDEAFFICKTLSSGRSRQFRAGSAEIILHAAKDFLVIYVSNRETVEDIVLTWTEVSTLVPHMRRFLDVMTTDFSWCNKMDVFTCIDIVAKDARIRPDNLLKALGLGGYVYPVEGSPGMACQIYGLLILSLKALLPYITE